MRPNRMLITRAIDVPASMSPSPSSSASTDPEPAWHSPVPYLFGGLAVMLGMIVIALFILACSYWRLIGYLNHADSNGDRQNSGGRNGRNKKSTDRDVEMTEPVREQVVVIMAGDEKPTFLATEANKTDGNSNCSRSSNNNNNNNNNNNDTSVTS